MTATLTFQSLALAKEFARAWAFHSLRGYSLSKKQPDGSVTLTLDGVTEQDKAWIEERIATVKPTE